MTEQALGPMHLGIAWRRVAASRRARLGIVLLGWIGLFAIFADVIAGDAPLLDLGPSGIAVAPGIVEPSGASADVDRGYDTTRGVWPLVQSGPEDTSGAPLERPSTSHWAGTDARGRDVLARLAHGARTSLGTSIVAIACSLVLGLGLGVVSGYLGGRWDRRLERLVETIHTFPAIVVVALLRTIEGEASPISVIVAVAVVRWAEVARLVRAEAMRLQMEDFVSAARALGSSRLRILTRHILPNALGPVIVSSVFGVASVALLETAISFLELGPPARAPSWGETLAQAARHPDAIHLLVGPGVLLALTVGGSYLIADALRDALDPHTTRVLPAGR